MKQFKVFKHPSGTIEAVKVGWSWPAFFFPFIWALFKKLWVLALILFIIAIALNFIVEIFSNGDEGLNAILNLISNISFGIFAAIKYLGINFSYFFHAEVNFRCNP